jgi:hypothetical protein
MRKTLLTCMAAMAALTAGAQVVNDTVSVGASYANQVWYSLQSDEQGSAPKNNWDIAFSVSGFGSTIFTNSASGVMLWNYPNSDASGWASVDTTGLSTWTPRYNSDTSWALGAMGKYADPSNPSDLDWGIYNMTMHIVTGDSIYIIKLVNGDYKKLLIEDLTGGIYHFKFANVDGTSPVTANLDKTSYSGKNFGYYSMVSGAALDREPASANWDLVFTQYTAFMPSAYTVTGILANAGTFLAKVTGLADKNTYVDYASSSFVTPINTIGYNWKTFGGTGYTVQDSTVFFVEVQNHDIWKVIMTGFSGSATGSSMFSKEKLYTYVPPSAVNRTELVTTSLVVYPNPAVVDVNVLYSLPQGTASCSLTIADVAGRVALARSLPAGSGLQQFVIGADMLSPGMYVVCINTDGVTKQVKLIIQ